MASPPTVFGICCGWVCERIREHYPKTIIRVNTNGHASLIHGQDVSCYFEGLVDIVSVSMNAHNAKAYDKICRSEYGLDAFDAMFRFAKVVKLFVPVVLFSVVRQYLTEKQIFECRRLCGMYRIPLRVREYIPRTPKAKTAKAKQQAEETEANSESAENKE